MKKNFNFLIITLVGLLFSLSSFKTAEDDWMTRCASNPDGVDTGRCYSTGNGNYECRPSINPFKTCSGTIGVGPLDPL